jgi:regulator of sigma E protease
MQIFLFIIALILFTGLILVHEAGHFWAARRNGVAVEEFGLGFPPRAWSRKTKKGTLLSLNWLPIGGFVRLRGEHDGDRRAGSFGAASLGAKTKIMLAGVLMNVVVAIVILTFSYLVGMPKLITADQFNEDQYALNGHVSSRQVLAIYVEPGSPAYKAGLRDLDTVVSLKSGGSIATIARADDLKNLTGQLAGRPAVLTYKHKGELVSRQLTLRSKGEIEAAKKAGQSKGYLGVEPYNLEFIRSGWAAPVNAVGFSVQVTKLSFVGLWHGVQGLGSLLAGAVTNNHQARSNGLNQASSQWGGPVAIFKVLWSSGSIGYLYMLAVIALISLALAIFNVLPIPALDGGRLFLIVFSRAVFKRPLSRLAEERIVAGGMVLLLSLTLLITVIDIKRFF